MRLQILELPTQYLGEVSHTPFVLVASEAKSDGGFNADWREQIGAAGIFITDEVVEIGPPPLHEPGALAKTADFLTRRT